jgi:hypothetical protein
VGITSFLRKLFTGAGMVAVLSWSSASLATTPGIEPPTESPAEAFRNFWEARVDHRDMDAVAQFYSQEMVENFRGLAPDALKDYAENMLEIYDQFVIEQSGTEQVNEQTANLVVTMPVVGEALKNEGIIFMRGGLRMIVENSRWRIADMDYRMMGEPIASASPEAPLPTGLVLGHADAPNILTSHQEDGERSVRFDAVTLYWTGQRFEMDFPVFGENKLRLELLFSGDRSKSEHQITLKGTPSNAGLPGMFGKEIAQPASVYGTFTFTDGAPVEGKKTFSARFDLAHPVKPEQRITGAVTNGRIIEMVPQKNVFEGESTFGGETHPVTDGLIVHDVHRNELLLSVVGPTGGVGQITFHQFTGAPGAYLEPRQTQNAEGQWIQRVGVVEVFDENQVNLKIRTMLLEELPPPPHTLANLGDAGTVMTEIRASGYLRRWVPTVVAAP